MSKWINTYNALKNDNKETIYIFKGGAFYNCLEEDAKQLNKIFGYTITKLNDNAIKAGFPPTALEKVIKFLKINNIDYKIIDNNTQITNEKDYLFDNLRKSFLNDIENLDLNTTTPIKLFNKILDFQNKIKTKKDEI